MKRILTIVGARPQFIKAAAISHAIRENYSDRITEDILHTGQHYDDRMSAQFFKELDIPQPRYNLDVGSGHHGEQTAAMIKGIEDILLSEHYDGVTVYGDTNSTLAGALAAAKLHVPVYHIEAGLRSFNRSMPEELNRILTDHASSLLFAPTKTAMQNLWNEGFRDDRVVFSGDVMLDNVRHYAPIAIQNAQFSNLNSQYILATVHRDFNTDNPIRLKNILSALDAVAEQHHATILFPLHPRTKKQIQSSGLNLSGLHFQIVEPLSYLETLAALQRCALVITDSGGLQKEAYFSHKACVVLRPETEWTEIVDAGAAILADDDKSLIVKAADELWKTQTPEPKEFGDGNASNTIIDSILQAFVRYKSDISPI